MDKALKDLVKISNAVGKDISLVQAGSGNTSAKTADGKYMYIKASGMPIKDMDENKGWRKVDVNMFLSVLDDDSLTKLDADAREAEIIKRSMLCCVDNVNTDARPSVEINLHAMLDKYVVHIHPDSVGVYVNAKNGKAEIGKLFKNEKLPPLWIPYAAPGYTLAKKTAGLVKLYQKQFGAKPGIIFLQKHGLLISAKTSQECLRLVKKVIKICSSKLKPLQLAKPRPVKADLIRDIKLSIRKAIFDSTGRYLPIQYFCDDIIAGFLRKRNAEKILSPLSMTPDEMVYTNGPAMWIERADPQIITKKLDLQVKKWKNAPKAFLVKNVGLFIASSRETANIIRDIIYSAFFIRSNALVLGRFNGLNKGQQQFRETEALNQPITNSQDEGQFKGRIAVVTGAGSGLGKSIAVELARAGAIVGLVDIDKKSAQQTEQIIRGEVPNGSDLVIPCNVTSETDVDKAFKSLIDEYGGLDILVNAAGVAPAYPLVEFPVKKWRQALEINLTGYFLIARAAAEIMIRQKMGGSIINISSKTGIDPSIDNSAYNVAKAGQLHLARGWAMELGKHNIRVNSICPGNVFEGSQIWNPQYIKICAKKYGIKPEEVIPFYTNKTMLKKEIKGRDIADAVMFLASDNASRITAQTLVVDGGQAIVR
ncbi:MAG: SDR family oxidoreductase [Planctomycetota bacterium]|jgi:NAD(P)-dependent dehydrogenase (short-subunit alcohol dehydrogenase family)/rhamnose utilization protein RhaD (predicted bifunctional aldolase and dehydrogenase)